MSTGAAKPANGMVQIAPHSGFAESGVFSMPLPLVLVLPHSFLPRLKITCNSSYFGEKHPSGCRVVSHKLS